jgi:hypothetical protein
LSWGNKHVICRKIKKGEKDWLYLDQELFPKTLLKKGWKGRDDENT